MFGRNQQVVGNWSCVLSACFTCARLRSTVTLLLLLLLLPSQALLVAGAHHHAASGDWAAVLCIDQPPATSGPNSSAPSEPAAAERARQRYRRIAAHVHPDKCSLPGAQRAFQIIADAHAALQQQYGDSTSSGRRGPRTGHDSGACGSGDDDEDGQYEQYAGFEWWGRWEFLDPLGAEVAEALRTEPTQQEAQEEGAHLWDMPLQVGRSAGWPLLWGWMVHVCAAQWLAVLQSLHGVSGWLAGTP